MTETKRGSRWERVATRIGSGLALLMMLAAPLSLVPMIWTADWRWLLSGVVLGVVGFGFGYVITEAPKRAKR